MDADNEYHGRSPGWGGILKGETELIHSLSAGNEPTVLFMSYPPPSGSMGIGMYLLKNHIPIVKFG